MKIPLMEIASALLYASAGFCLFLTLLNRVLILLPDSKAKTPVMLATFATFTGAGASLGFFLAHPPWVYIPMVLLVLLLVGELHRLSIRRSCTGSPPIDTIPHPRDLATPVTTTALVVHRYRLSHPKWHGAPLRIVHLTDLHVHPSLPLEYYRQVLTVAEESDPDIAVFTGDFISRLDALPKLAEVLRPIARRETYAVLGNHDYWAGADAVRTVITESGIHLLSNETATLTIGESPIAISGYDYPWGKKAKHLPPRRADMLHVVLSHTPDNIYRLSGSSADIVFSGHYHAGQIRAPLIGPIIIPSVYGRRFDHGHFVVNATHLFVASGVGAANPPVRIYCQPDIFVVDIAGKQEGDA